ncbi:hypothetical protein C8F04DRAFT_1264131 [Mycena alexandri]|uniref:Uncharacterized protein n=1 Tax=Mycena alexandri TaxID=1745969 RepID=A0AAD6WWN4_9AGAR|nr:hypothetical protein C8F04DRAFT_1264131 [Mycena alexandri]
MGGRKPEEEALTDLRRRGITSSAPGVYSARSGAGGAHKPAAAAASSNTRSRSSLHRQPRASERILPTVRVCGRVVPAAPTVASCFSLSRLSPRFPASRNRTPPILCPRGAKPPASRPPRPPPPSPHAPTPLRTNVHPPPPPLLPFPLPLLRRLVAELRCEAARGVPAMRVTHVCNEEKGSVVVRSSE